MTAWLLTLLKYVPGIGAILDKLGHASSKADEIRAQVELDDIKGFHRTGRVSAAHLWKYVMVALAFLLTVMFGVSAFFPEAAGNFRTVLGSLVETLETLFAVGP